MQSLEMLRDLGVHKNLLNPDQYQTLDDKGYLALPGIFPKDLASAMARRLGLLSELEGDSAGKEVHQETGTARLANLVDKGEIFRICFSHPTVLAAIAHVLNDDFKLSSLNSRAALPGQGLQALHADWSHAVMPGNYQVCNSIWLLDDFTAENGATRAVPGMHRSGKMPQEMMSDPRADHPNQEVIIAPAGTVLVLNSHTWHGGTLNRTKFPRRAIHSYFCTHDQSQQTNQRQHLSPATIAAFSPEIRYLLDVV